MSSTAIIVETRLHEISSEIKNRLKRNFEDVLEIGKLALEAKGLIPHGGFINWITEDLGLSRRLISSYMRVYERFNKRENFAHLPVSALLLLASPTVSDGLIEEVSSQIEQGERFTVEGIDNLIDRYRVLEGAKIGSEALLEHFGKKEDGSPAPTISRSAVTSLIKVADEGLQHGAITLDGVDRPVNLTLPQAVIEGVRQETQRRQSEHIDDNVVKKIYLKANVYAVNGYLQLSLVDNDPAMYKRLGNGQQVTISFEVKD